MLDVLLRGATVADGTGAPPRRADVGIRGDRIALVGETTEGARETVDCAGLVLAPGFVDLHSHADFSIRQAPVAEACLRQGVTTIVTGNCGSSPFPGVPGGDASLTTISERDAAVWPDFAGFAAAVEESEPAINVAALAGHAALRSAVAGNELRELTAEELARVCELLAEQARQGVFGFSSGLIYAPGSFAPPQELVALAETAARAGLLYSTHMRDEGDHLLDAVEEALETARRTGVRLQISHLKAMGPANHGKVREALSRIRQARTEGLDVACDVYPYAASSTRLSSRLPDWALDGGLPALVSRLHDGETRARIREELDARIGRTVLPEGTVLAALPPGPYRKWVGSSLAEIAAAEGRPPADTALDVLREHAGDVWIVNHAMAESDVDTVLADELSAIASDGWVLDTGQGGHPHPRHFGTFARALGEYSRERGVVGLAEAVRKCSALPAGRIGLTDRGTIAEGMVADLTAFDAGTVIDTATYEAPLCYATGTSHVLVGGRFALRDGEVTRERPGRVLRRS
ncbi:N-acyl-D-amino-acid deacylase [Amycolatopsis sacchari]|uniref:N-acyl-D-amino-acid deacylase n=1 Tax=Amycolatopsis sacchari TaxID=115433 RepID=A0A1I3Q1V8_9PSEU|nr:D-aminoacylase [Amycolatopsis sacchari]SFJ27695.1 N-acyl-D-amino-acid deacylase [Amycolatopsis sacchari]